MYVQSLDLVYTTTDRFHFAKLNGVKVSRKELENHFNVAIPVRFNYPTLGRLAKTLKASNVALSYDNDFDCF